MEAQPFDVFHDGIDVRSFFLFRVGVVEAEIGMSVELVGQSEVEANGLGMPDVKIPVRFRRESSLHPSRKFSGLQVVEDDVANEVRWCGRRLRGSLLMGLVWGTGGIHDFFGPSRQHCYRRCHYSDYQKNKGSAAESPREALSRMRAKFTAW